MTDADVGESAHSVTAADRRMLWRGRVRGVLCIAAVVLAPVLIGGAYVGIRQNLIASSDDSSFADDMAFMAVWGWGNFVYPHPSITEPRPGGYDVVIAYPAVVAIFQWAVVALVFGLVTDRWRFRWQFPAALAIVVLVSLTIHVGAGLFGWQIQIDGP